jgi:hypothetical protein
MKYPRYHLLLSERELRRIGVDVDRLGGLGVTFSAGPDAFLRWLRTIPGGIGHDAFLHRLELPPSEGGPHDPLPNEPEAADVATYVNPELDEQLAYYTELDRVAPPDTRAGFGYNLPRGRAHALQVLRSLPDGAGMRAFLSALYSDTSLSGDGDV